MSITKVNINGIDELAINSDININPVVTSGSTALDLTGLGVISSIQDEAYTYASDSGSVNAFVVTLSPAPSSYVSGLIAEFKAAHTNTGSSTINVNGLGTKTIKKLDGATNLSAGDIVLGQVVTVIYDGTNFQMQSPSAIAGGGGGSGTVTSIATSAPITGGTITTSGTIGFAGTDINSSGNVVASHLSSPLPILQGGTGTTTPSLVAGTNVTISGSWPNQTVNSSGGGGGGTVTTTGSPASGNLTKFSGSTSVTNGDLSGDVTTSGTLATTVVKINNGSVPASAAALATNSSSQPIAATLSGNTSTLATTSGTLTSGHLAKFDISGNVIDGGAISSGTVTSIATTAPITGGTITSSGTIGFAGTDINSSGNVVATHLSSPLPVLQGGTGTTTPGIVAGTNVSVTGTWPNQTVNSTSGGSGTVTSIATTAPITGGTITSTGTIGFAGTDINSSGNVVATHLTSPLPVIQGGTGVTTPSIVAGTNISVSGTWPNQTVTSTSGGSLFLNGMNTLPIALASWTWVNQGTSTAVQRGGAPGPIFMSIADNASLNWRFLLKTPPSTPYKSQFMIRGQQPQANSNTVGVYVRNSSSGKIIGMEALAQAGTTYNLRAERLTNFNTDNTTISNVAFNSFTVGGVMPGVGTVWQIRNDATNLYFDYCPDGVNCINFVTEALATFISSVDQIGIGGISVTGTASNTANIFLMGYQEYSNANI